MAFARHNIEKRRLIEMVRLNPILWDCRLPHYKRSDKKKALKWNELGRIFNVNGERVQRTFTSLREIFRRELNHEKMLGSRFKSKWEYYEEMAFLKEVIRERKSRERAKSGDVPSQTVQNVSNNSNGIDEYQYFAPNDPNNPQNQPKQQQQPPPQQQQQQQQQSVPALSLTIPQQTTPSICQTALVTPANPPNTPVTPQTPIQLQSEMLLNLNATALAALQKFTANGNGANAIRPLSRARSLITRSCSSSPSIYIKEEVDSLDDTISVDTLSQSKATNNRKTLSVCRNVTKDKPNQANLDNINNKNLHNSNQNLVINEQAEGSDLDDDPDVDMLDDRLSIATSLVSLVKETRGNNAVGAIGEPNPKKALPSPYALQRPTAREILYTKFGEFLAARLNTLNETVANELMNKILMLIAEK
uniref:MADF domain-containing protein n=1 Tax=Glossina pallidipes TaxID=7398 RepID=A0A1A9ZA43_GLOPL